MNPLEHQEDPKQALASNDPATALSVPKSDSGFNSDNSEQAMGPIFTEMTTANKRELNKVTAEVDTVEAKDTTDIADDAATGGQAPTTEPSTRELVKKG